MKSLTRYDWFLVIIGVAIFVYLWAAMITGVIEEWPFGKSGGGWFGSFVSILVGLLFLVLWMVLALVRGVKLLYSELTQKDKEFLCKIAHNALLEFAKRIEAQPEQQTQRKIT
jgi:hypothetical protein